MRLYYEFVGYMPEKPVEQVGRNFDKYLTKFKNNYWVKKDVRKVVIWTPFFGAWSWAEDAKASTESCPAKCIYTTDKSAVSSADGVLFHANDLWNRRGLLGTLYNSDIEMPSSRTPNQVWAVLSWEPMVYMWGKIKPNTFNWTMLYRRESTVYNPFTPWRKMPQEELKTNIKTKSSENFLATKKKFASAMISNCFDQGKRYKIIRELQRYIDVDVFGKCSGNIICKAGIPTTECGKMFLTEYKFYLAFENSFCRDYVSEKFWNALDRHQIPVIAAPKYNLELLPPNSYLNVFDFPSIKALANRMKEIASNATLYNSFFDWMQYWKQDTESIYCKFCQELHVNRTAQSYSDMEGWIKDEDRKSVV